MQVHNLVDVDTHLATLAGWKRDGRVRYVGVTHYTAGGHEAVARLIASKPVDFVQINYSVGERDAERRLLPLAQERGVAVIANRPFAGGDLFRRLREQAAARVGGRDRLRQLGAGPAQVRRVASRDHLRDPRHVARGPPARQHEGRLRAAARREAPGEDRRRSRVAGNGIPGTSETRG